MTKKKRDSDEGISPELAEALKAPMKIRITTMVDQDVYTALKSMAGKNGKYQTVLNAVLREALFGKKTTAIERRLEKVERQIEELTEKSKRRRA